MPVAATRIGTRVNDGLDSAQRVSNSHGVPEDRCVRMALRSPRGLPTLPDATRRAAAVQAMTFDGTDACPSRSAAAVALVPAEQQCDETLRGGRTQLDVDGAVSGDRF
jgi:predicted component of type VI protein secretion system